MKHILHHIIYPKQGAFIDDRCISDNVIIAQKFMFDMLKAPIHRSLMAIKFDLERAYDCMQ